MVGAAETGSGKTLAFALPLLYGVMKEKQRTAAAAAAADAGAGKRCDKLALVASERVFAVLLSRNVYHVGCTNVFYV